MRMNSKMKRSKKSIKKLQTSRRRLPTGWPRGRPHNISRSRKQREMPATTDTLNLSKEKSKNAQKFPTK